MFSWANKWKHASCGRNKKSVELVQKNLAELHCKFFMQHQNNKTSSAVKKNIICQQVFLKRNCVMSAEKYQSSYFTIDVGWKISVGASSRPMSAIEFSIQSLNEICMMSVRKCSIGVMRWCFLFNLDRSSFLADVDWHFFQSISVKNNFLSRRANVFMAE